MTRSPSNTLISPALCAWTQFLFLWISQKSARYSIDYALCKMAIALDFDMGAWTRFQKSQLNTKLTKMYCAKRPSRWILKS